MKCAYIPSQPWLVFYCAKNVTRFAWKINLTLLINDDNGQFTKQLNGTKCYGRIILDKNGTRSPAEVFVPMEENQIKFYRKSVTPSIDMMHQAYQGLSFRVNQQYGLFKLRALIIGQNYKTLIAIVRIEHIFYVRRSLSVIQSDGPRSIRHETPVYMRI